MSSSKEWTLEWNLEWYPETNLQPHRPIHQWMKRMISTLPPIHQCYIHHQRIPSLTQMLAHQNQPTRWKRNH